MYINLPGIKRQNPEYEFFRNITNALKIVRKGLVASAAGDHGAIDFYKDDNNKYRCNLHRHRITEDTQIFKKQKDAVVWLKNNLMTIY